MNSAQSNSWELNYGDASITDTGIKTQGLQL